MNRHAHRSAGGGRHSCSRRATTAVPPRTSPASSQLAPRRRPDHAVRLSAGGVSRLAAWWRQRHGPSCRLRLVVGACYRSSILAEAVWFRCSAAVACVGHLFPSGDATRSAARNSVAMDLVSTPTNARRVRPLRSASGTGNQHISLRHPEGSAGSSRMLRSVLPGACGGLALEDFACSLAGSPDGLGGGRVCCGSPATPSRPNPRQPRLPIRSPARS